MGDINSINVGLAMFYMMKTSYISHGPDHRKSWKVDLTIYSTDKNAPEGTGQSTSKMRTRAHIYSDHAAQVNFSSHEYQTLEAMDNIPGTHEDPKPMIWKTPPVFTSTPSESLVNPTPMRMNPPSSTPARDHENRMSTGSMKKSPASTTSKSDVKPEVLSTPRRSTRMQFKHPVTLSPATATTEMDTTTPALAKLGRMVIEHLQISGGAINQMQNSGEAVQSYMGAVQDFTGAVQDFTGAVQNSTGAVQNSTGKKPKRRNKNKVTPPEPRRFGTRQRKSVDRLDK